MPKLASGTNCVTESTSTAVSTDYCATGTICLTNCCQYHDKNCASCNATGICDACLSGFFFFPDDIVGRVCVDRALKRWNLRDSELKCLPTTEGGLKDCTFRGLTEVPPHIRGSNSSEYSIIYLQDNQIPEIFPLTFAGMSSLVEIRLNNNIITSVGANAFIDCPQLTTLILSNNNINFLGAGAFYNLPSLQTWKLDQNALGSLPADSWDSVIFTSLRSLEIGFNSIRTDSADQDLEYREIFRTSLQPFIAAGVF
jgi:hypothetical protein